MTNNSTRKNVSSDRVPDKIDLFIEGDSATPLDPYIMNQIVRSINRNSNMIGQNGIRVTKSDSNIIIAFDTRLFSGSLGTGGTGDTQNYYTNVNCVCRYS